MSENYLNYKIEVFEDVIKKYILSVYISEKYFQKFVGTKLLSTKPVFEIIMNFFESPAGGLVVQLEKIINYQISQELSKDNLSEDEKTFFSRRGYNYLCILSNFLKLDNPSAIFDNIDIFVIPVTTDIYGGQKKLEEYYKSMGFEENKDYPGSFEMKFIEFLKNCDQQQKPR